VEGGGGGLAPPIPVSMEPILIGRKPDDYHLAPDYCCVSDVYASESQRKRGHYQEQDVGGWTMLTCILDRTGCYALDRTGSG
jgi:hypothetical protein